MAKKPKRDRHYYGDQKPQAPGKPSKTVLVKKLRKKKSV